MFFKQIYSSKTFVTLLSVRDTMWCQNCRTDNLREITNLVMIEYNNLLYSLIL